MATGQVFKDADEILEFAISREQEAYEFYVDLAGKTKDPSLKEAFLSYSKEELGHKQKIEAVKTGKRLLPVSKKVTDLKIGDYLVDVEPKENMDYQQALILAMKREKAAYRLYTDIANISDDSELQLLFLALAQEEAKHKLRFEVAYDDVILRDN